MNRTVVALMIDDDADDQMFFEMAVSGLGVPVECRFANNALIALCMLEDDGFMPDLIFVDFNMPKMNGLDFIERINQNHLLRQIPVYLYSTSNDRVMAQKCIALGGAGLIKKETTLTAIREKLKCTFEKHIPIQS